MTRAENVLPRAPLRTLPMQIDRWHGRDSAPFTPAVLKALGADDYVNRVYRANREPEVGLYVGFYESQRQGDTIHSPLNCLPGAGWEPVRQDRISIPVAGADGKSRSIAVNSFVIQKGLDRQIALYWYQSHGRVIASEYSSKFFMVYDAIRLNRSDAAMVRVITPIAEAGPEGEHAAVGRATEFVQRIFRSLTEVLPL